MAKTTDRQNSAYMHPPRRQASLDAYVGFRDTTHGTDVSNAPAAPVPKGGRQPNRVPYRGGPHDVSV